MSNDINTKLDEDVLKKWKSRINDNPTEVDKHFTSDGLMCNDLSVSELNVAWNESPRRVLFLLRDQYQHRPKGTPTWDEDIRATWLKNEDNRNLKGSFMQYLAYLLWSLSKTNDVDQWWLPEVIKHIDEVKKFFVTQPFTLVECKKVPGNSTVDKDVVKRHLHDYGDLLQDEIRLLNPNIIVCAGGEIYDYMIHDSYLSEGLVKEEGGQNYYYQPKSDTVILFSEHPGSQNYKGGRYEMKEDFYEGIMFHYRKFLKYRESL